MKKLALITHIQDLDKITNELMWLGAVEISSSESFGYYDEKSEKSGDSEIFDQPGRSKKSEQSEWRTAISKVDAGTQLSEIDKKLSDLTSAIDLCKTYEPKKKRIVFS